jgi:predicted kinase
MYNKLKDITRLDITNLVQRGPGEVPSYFSQVNPDVVKPGIAGYDPKNPGLVHTMSSDISKAAFFARVQTGDPLIVDGTGTNYGKVAEMIAIAKANGYRVTLVWVRVPLIVNHIRNATRSRSIPPGMVTKQYLAIEKNFAKLKPLADRAVVVNNRSERVNEKGALELDAMDVANYVRNREKVDALYEHEGFKSFYAYVSDDHVIGKEQFRKELPEWESVLLKGVKDRTQGGFRANPHLASLKGIASKVASLYRRTMG